MSECVCVCVCQRHNVTEEILSPGLEGGGAGNRSRHHGKGGVHKEFVVLFRMEGSEVRAVLSTHPAPPTEHRYAPGAGNGPSVSTASELPLLM